MDNGSGYRRIDFKFIHDWKKSSPSEPEAAAEGLTVTSTAEKQAKVDVQILPRFLRQDFPDSAASTAEKEAQVHVQILLRFLRQDFPESTAFDALTDFDASTVVPRDFCEKVTGSKRHNMTHTRTEAPTTTWTTQRGSGRAPQEVVETLSKMSKSLSALM